MSTDNLRVVREVTPQQEDLMIEAGVEFYPAELYDDKKNIYELNGFLKGIRCVLENPERFLLKPLNP